MPASQPTRPPPLTPEDTRLCLSLFLRMQLDEGFDDVLLLTKMHTEATVGAENGFTNAPSEVHIRIVGGSLSRFSWGPPRIWHDRYHI